MNKNNCFKFHGFHTSRESFHFENGKLKNIEIQIYSDNLERLSKIHRRIRLIRKNREQNGLI